MLECKQDQVQMFVKANITFFKEKDFWITANTRLIREGNDRTLVIIISIVVSVHFLIIINNIIIFNMGDQGLPVYNPIS